MDKNVFISKRLQDNHLTFFTHKTKMCFPLDDNKYISTTKKDVTYLLDHNERMREWNFVRSDKMLPNVKKKSNFFYRRKL